MSDTTAMTISPHYSAGLSGKTPPNFEQRAFFDPVPQDRDPTTLAAVNE